MNRGIRTSSSSSDVLKPHKSVEHITRSLPFNRTVAAAPIDDFRDWKSSHADDVESYVQWFDDVVALEFLGVPRTGKEV